MGRSQQLGMFMMAIAAIQMLIVNDRRHAAKLPVIALPVVTAVGIECPDLLGRLDDGEHRARPCRARIRDAIPSVV